MTWQGEYKQGYRDAAPVARWTLWKALLWTAGLSILFGGIGLFTGVFSSAKGVLSRTIDPDNIIYNYEWFHSRNEAFKAYSLQRKDFNAQIDQSGNDLQVPMEIHLEGGPVPGGRLGVGVGCDVKGQVVGGVLQSEL